MQWDWRRTNCGTGFSREGAGYHAAESMVTALASSRLKPVPLGNRVHAVGLRRSNCGTGFSREGAGCHAAESMVLALVPSRLKPVPLGNRVHAEGLAAHPLWDRL